MNSQAGFSPHVTVMGQGLRRVLALHCSLAFGGAWAGLTKQLGQDLTFVAPDMPSHGGSADWDEESDFSDTVFRAAADTLGQASMDVVGHSYGAVIALRLAALYSTQVRSLTLIEPVFFAVANRDAPHTMQEHDVHSIPFVRAVESGNRAKSARLFNRMWGDGPQWNDLPEKSRAAMIRAIPVIPATYEFLYNDAAGILAPGVLENANMPTLLIRGAAAQPAVTAIADGLVRRLPNATQFVIEGAGHMAPITHPGLVARAIQDLLGHS